MRQQRNNTSEFWGQLPILKFQFSSPSLATQQYGAWESGAFAAAWSRFNGAPAKAEAPSYSSSSASQYRKSIQLS